MLEERELDEPEAFLELVELGQFVLEVGRPVPSLGLGGALDVPLFGDRGFDGDLDLEHFLSAVDKDCVARDRALDFPEVLMEPGLQLVPPGRELVVLGVDARVGLDLSLLAGVGAVKHGGHLGQRAAEWGKGRLDDLGQELRVLESLSCHRVGGEGGCGKPGGPVKRVEDVEKLGERAGSRVDAGDEALDVWECAEEALDLFCQLGGGAEDLDGVLAEGDGRGRDQRVGELVAEPALAKGGDAKHGQLVERPAGRPVDRVVEHVEVEQGLPVHHHALGRSDDVVHGERALRDEIGGALHLVQVGKEPAQCVGTEPVVQRVCERGRNGGGVRVDAPRPGGRLGAVPKAGAADERDQPRGERNVDPEEGENLLGEAVFLVEDLDRLDLDQDGFEEGQVVVVVELGGGKLAGGAVDKGHANLAPGGGDGALDDGHEEAGVGRAEHVLVDHGARGEDLLELAADERGRGGLCALLAGNVGPDLGLGLGDACDLVPQRNELGGPLLKVHLGDATHPHVGPVGHLEAQDLVCNVCVLLKQLVELALLHKQNRVVQVLLDGPVLLLKVGQLVLPLGRKHCRVDVQRRRIVPFFPLGNPVGIPHVFQERVPPLVLCFKHLFLLCPLDLLCRHHHHPGCGGGGGGGGGGGVGRRRGAHFECVERVARRCCRGGGR